MLAAPSTVDPASEPQVRDGWVRLIGITCFGLVIPRAVDLFGPIGPSQPIYWFGTVAFVVLAAVIWQGNRWLLFRQQARLSWLARPIAKLIGLTFACTIYTAPLTAAFISAWFVVASLPFSSEQVVLVSLINVICVLFVTHVYETVFLIQARESDQIRVERLQRTAATAQLETLRQQVDPHFLFNSLNTLGALIETDAAKASAFCSALSDLYRYLLQTQSQPLVPIADEVQHLRSYGLLLSLRFGGAVEIEIAGEEQGWVLPCALQTLVENAVKHNQFDSDRRLIVQVKLQTSHVVVQHPFRARSDQAPSLGVGLENLDERSRLLMAQPLSVERGEQFVVKLPLAKAPA